MWFNLAYDGITEKPPSICASTKGYSRPKSRSNLLDLRGTLPEKRVTFTDMAIMLEHFRNGTNDPFLSNFFDDDHQQLDSLFDTTYLRRKWTL